MNVRHLLATYCSITRASSRRRSSGRRREAVECLERRELLAVDVSLLRNIRERSASSVPGPGGQTVVEYNGEVYFQGDDSPYLYGYDHELWRTDGTAANTEEFLDIVKGGGRGSVPDAMIVINGKLLFAAATGKPSRALFATDGTVAGTTMLGDYGVYSPMKSIGVIGPNAYFFHASDGTYTDVGHFWKSDGTISGTGWVATTGIPDNEFGTSFIFDNTIFFSAKATGQSSARSLWKVVGEYGIEIPNTPLQVSGFQVVGSQLYFSAASDATSAPRLWRMDSASAAPVPVQAEDSPTIALGPENFTNFNGTLYFTARDDGDGTELWKSDGTSAGTALVKDINPGNADSTPQLLTVVESALFFEADDGIHGQELWRSDGTEAGTFLVRDGVAGSTGSAPQAMFNLNGLLLFTASTSESTLPVMWTSDGTEPGTNPVNNVVVSAASNFVQLGNTAIFAAENVNAGRELFIFRIGDKPAAPVITGPGTINSTVRPTVTWDAAGTATEYEIWIGNNSTRKSPVVLANVSGTSFTPSSDLGIGIFTAWVRTQGLDGAPHSEWSSQLTFRIKAPVIQELVETNPAIGLAKIAWQPLTGATKYDVWIDRLDVPTEQVYRNSTVTGTSVTPISLPHGKYRVWVRGIAADGSVGAWSISQDFTETLVPVITGGLNPTFDTTPTISWTAVPGATSYEVYVLSINGNFKALHQKDILETTFTWPELPVGPYRYWVRATGAIAWSAPVDIDTSGRTDVVVPIEFIFDGKPDISWRPVDGVLYYRLWMDHVGVQRHAIGSTFSTNHYIPYDVLPAGLWRIWVQAVSSTTTAQWSRPVDLMIADAEVPAGLTDDFELLTSVFRDSELAMLFHENDQSSSEVPDVAGETPDVLAEEPEVESLSVAWASADSANRFFTYPTDSTQRVRVGTKG